MKQLTISNGVNTFDFVDSIENLNIQSAEGFGYPNVVDVVELLPGRSGALYIDSDFGTRVLSWTGVFHGYNRNTRRRQLQQALSQGQLLTLAFTTFDDLELQIECYLKSLSMPVNKQFTAYNINLVCPDHRFVSQELQVSSTGVTAVVGGTALPTALPLSLAITGGSSSLSVENGGNEYALPEFIITGPGTNFIVQNQTTGESFNVNVTLTAGETITVDVLNREVIQGNNQNQYGSFSGDFWELAPGTNEIYFNADSGTSGGTLLTVNYRHSYRGI